MISNKNLLFKDAKGEERLMGINFLEMATIYMALEVAAGNFETDAFTLYCDNMASVQVLNSY